MNKINQIKSNQIKDMITQHYYTYFYFTAGGWLLYLFKNYYFKNWMKILKSYKLTCLQLHLELIIINSICLLILIKNTWFHRILLARWLIKITTVWRSKCETKKKRRGKNTRFPQLPDNPTEKEYIYITHTHTTTTTN